MCQRWAECKPKTVKLIAHFDRVEWFFFWKMTISAIMCICISNECVQPKNQWCAWIVNSSFLLFSHQWNIWCSSDFHWNIHPKAVNSQRRSSYSMIIRGDADIALVTKKWGICLSQQCLKVNIIFLRWLLYEIRQAHWTWNKLTFLT